MNKSEILTNEVKHIDITSFDSRPLVESMKQMSFSSGETGRAANILAQMLADPDCTIILTLAGSTPAAGCMAVYADLVRYNMVDVVVATGASVVDMDFFEALGFRHYRADGYINDDRLRQLGIDRIYDTYIDEDSLQQCDRTIRDIADALPPVPYSSRAFIQEMGRWLAHHSVKKDSMVQLAFENDVPVFSPAFTDSSAGFGLVMHQTRKPDNHLTLDSIRDFRELTRIKIQAGETGLLMIGGGAPKNFAQDTVVCAELLGTAVPMHKYAIQITVADPRDGGCSGSTLREACSWGKVDLAREQMVYAEATTILPLLASAAYHDGHWRTRERRRWSGLFQSGS